ncbi:MAG TPA: heme-copper oxidase subunit III [Methylomirabilota bacterium]|nr:heme-copper oxidase subunit III [Methylomirabilota bacterium]
MPGATTTQELDPPVAEKKNGGGGGGDLPPAGGNGGGDGDKNRRRQPSPNRYYTGMAIGIIAVLMFFMALASAFLVRKGGADWAPVRIPALLWLNTAVLVASSITLEMARKRLSRSDEAGFRKLWLVTTLLGVVFLIGQVAAWRILVGQGIYLASNPASSFFYIFTGAHALHLLGGVGALIYVARRNFRQADVTQSVAAEVTSYYWHFMDALWVFLLALLYLGK